MLYQNVDVQYLNLLQEILFCGHISDNRTGIKTLAIPSATIRIDMQQGFPLLTTKKVPFKMVASELEFFIKGITSKKWLQDRHNTIWNEWCNPKKVKYAHDEETKRKMLEEDDLGLIYGYQWRNFSDPDGNNGIDQLAQIVNTLKTNPNDRRMLCLAWNPLALNQMALPPCHFCFRVNVIGKKLHLAWDQRSVDTALGLPYNIASYALLQLLLCKESGYEAGELCGNLSNVHIYENQISGCKTQLDRKPYSLPCVDFSKFNSIFNWEYTDTLLLHYNSHPAIKFPIAI